MHIHADHPAALHRGWRLAVVVALVLLLSARAAPSAKARGLNRRSDHAALAAYNRYLRSLIARTSVGSRRDEGLVHRVHSSCLGYLSPFAGEISSSAGNAFGVEIGADIAIRFTSANGKPLRRLSSRLLRLRWSSGAIAKTVRDFVAAERDLLSMNISNLCADAIELGFHPTHVGARTRTFDSDFTAATATVTQALSDFVSVLQRFEPPGDGRLIARIDHHAASYQRLANAIETTDRGILIQDLGLNALT